MEPARAGAGAPAPFSRDGDTIRTPYYELTTAADGSIASLTDLRTGRGVFAEDGAATCSSSSATRPGSVRRGRSTRTPGRTLSTFSGSERAETAEKGPLRFVLRSTWRIGVRSRIVQDLVLYHASPRIDFATTAEWHESQTLLKVAFPFAVPADAVTYEIQFGALAGDPGRAGQGEGRVEPRDSAG